MTHMMNHTILLYHAYVDDTRYLVDDRPPGRPEMEDIIVTCQYFLATKNEFANSLPFGRADAFLLLQGYVRYVPYLTTQAR